MFHLYSQTKIICVIYVGESINNRSRKIFKIKKFQEKLYPRVPWTTGYQTVMR